LLYLQAMQVAQRQWQDLSKAKEAGSASALELLQAHQAWLERQRQRRQAQTDLSAALRDLLTLTQGRCEADLSLPSASPDPKASLQAQLDGIEATLGSLLPCAEKPADPNPPRAESLAQQSEAARLQSAALRASALPKISVFGRTGYDWPNGAAPEAIQQSVYGIKGTWPLFNGGSVWNQAQAQKHQAQALQSQTQALMEQLQKDRQKSLDRWHGLMDQAALAKQAAAEAQEAAGMTESSWKAGRSTFTEVLSSNLKSLEAATTLQRLQAQAILELSLLDALSAQ
jgi:outer membrane protein TolC